MIINKKQAMEKEIFESKLCEFHLNNPDQEGTYNCVECVLIRDECGCDEDSICEECDKGVWSHDLENKLSFKKIRCDSCLKIKRPFYTGSNLCQNCAISMDNHLEGEND